jgi:hypothetical protein
MNSLTLKKSGFAEFVPLKGLQFSTVPHEKASVLVLADTTVTGTSVSDILYIGRSKKPSKRVFGGYLGGYGRKATKKISSKLLNDGFIEKVAVSWMLNDNPKEAQQELLENFKKEHGEYPAWNASKKATVNSQPATQKVVKARPASKQPVKPAP